MRVVGVKRTIREEDEAWNYANELHETANLQTVIGEADYVVLTLPGTPETRHLLDRESLAAIKPGAYLVNIGRGSVVNEAALVESIKNGYLSGAALDVFEVEPLPEDSPLWTMENVIVSPHSTDVVPELVNRLQVDLFCENLRRYLGGEPLVNILNKELLY
jgi:phosphoglycerate dehydrogenase-like enzyme